MYIYPLALAPTPVAIPPCYLLLEFQNTSTAAAVAPIAADINPFISPSTTILSATNHINVNSPKPFSGKQSDIDL